MTTHRRRPAAARRWRRPPTAYGTTSSTWARHRARDTSGRRSAPPTCSPPSTPTNCATGPTIRTGKAGTGSCCRPGTTPSGCTPRWPKPASSPSAELDTYGSDGSRLPMSGMASYTPGMEISGGSLGHGLTVAVGMALGLRHQGSPSRIINFLSDGELDEGSTWEAAMGASHHRLGNLTALVDINALQADGPTAGVLRTEPVTDKWDRLRLVRSPGRRQRRRRAAGRLRRHRRPALPSPAHRRSSCATPGSAAACRCSKPERKRTSCASTPTNGRLCRDQLTAGYKENEQAMNTAAPLRTSAMIASFADPGQTHHPGPLRARPGGRGAGRRPDRGPDRRPR